MSKKMNKEMLQKIYENFETYDLLKAVDFYDNIRVLVADDGIAPPDSPSRSQRRIWY